METVRRGYEPKDEKEFGPKAAGKLNASAQELLFLMNRGYDTKSASTFVGNHHLLSERQRLALARITSTQAALRSGRKSGCSMRRPAGWGAWSAGHGRRDCRRLCRVGAQARYP